MPGAGHIVSVTVSPDEKAPPRAPSVACFKFKQSCSSQIQCEGHYPPLCFRFVTY